jgi:MoaA/NifB/PqqE/SkfB family radical SAM enzyme
MLPSIYKIIAYNFLKKTGYPRALPKILAFNVNDWCNSHCKTCNIWANDPKVKIAEQLKPEEYKKIIANFDSVYWVTITGGEPFLREDLPEIIKIVYEKSKPQFMTIATNAILTKKIITNVKRILKLCPNLKLFVNLSIDGIRKKHDEIRGFKGSYDMVMNTFRELKNINNNHLFVGFNTVISNLNIKKFPQIYEQLQRLHPDSYICEMAENRANLGNLELRITPEDDEYQRVLKFLISAFSNQRRKGTSELVRRLRIQFYKYLVSNKKINNYEGIASAYIMSNGEVWLSCSKKFIAGNLRDVNYDFRKIWFSEKAERYRKIMNSNYSTISVNAFYTNFICNPRNIFKLILL